jgi:hypothetical protein
MNVLFPPQIFRIKFDQIRGDGRRQEDLHPANEGEFDIVQKMHSFFNLEVIPRIHHDDWVFEAAQKFATAYADDYFRYFCLAVPEVSTSQETLHAINDKIVNFLAQASILGAATLEGDLPKASDFLGCLDFDQLPNRMKAEAQILYEQATDHEATQLQSTLRAIRDNYEVALPRVMFVVRRAIKVELRLTPKESDNELQGISQYISWYNDRIGDNHPLQPVLGNLQSFYKIARNAGSHHHGLIWKPDTNEVILRDLDGMHPFPVLEFQQKYRHIIYLCELGLHGILSAYCEREKGELSNSLVTKYLKVNLNISSNEAKELVHFYPVPANTNYR